MKKIFIGLTIIGSILTAGIYQTALGVVLQGNGGGTGISTSTPANDGLCLVESSSTPFLTWKLGACGSGGSGSVSTTTPYTVGNLVVVSSSGALSTTSTIPLTVYSRAATKTVCASNAADTTNCDYKASGTADNTVIQTAENAIQALPGGGHLVFSDGTFNIAAPVIVSSSNIMWTGQGASTEFFLNNGVNQAPIIISSGTLYQNNYFANFQVFGNLSNNSGANADCIFAGGTTQTTFTNLWLTQCSNIGLYITGKFDGTYGYNDHVFDNQIDGNGQIGIESNNEDENNIYDNKINTMRQYSIVDSSGLNQIWGNLIDATNATSAVGIYVQFHANSNVHDNILDGIPSTGIILDGSNNSANNNFLYGADDQVAFGCAIIVKTGSYNSVTNNHVSADGGGVPNYGWAYCEQNNPTYSLVSGNSFQKGTVDVFSGGSPTDQFLNNQTATSTPSNQVFWTGVNASSNYELNVPLSTETFQFDASGTPLFPNSLLYGTSTGALTPLTIGANLSISGGTLNAAGGSGGGSGGVSTSTLGSYPAGSVVFVINSSTISATSGVNIASGTGNFYTLGAIAIGTSTTSIQPLYVTGNAEISAADQSKAYRFRTSGSAMDLEGAGAALDLSDWSGQNFTGTQQNYFSISNSSHNLYAAGNWYFQDGNDVFGHGGNPVLSITADPNNGVAVGTTTTAGIGGFYANNTSTFNGKVQILSNNLVDAAGNKYVTSTPSSGNGNLFVSPTSTVLANNLVKFQTAGSSTVAQTSSLYSFADGGISNGTSTEKGAINLVNASTGIPILQASTSTLATSSVALNILNNSSTATTQYSSFQILGDGHLNSTGTIPTISSCGTNPTIIGTDTWGVITVGSVTATGCTITFQVPLETSNYAVNVFSETSLTTAVGVSGKTNTGFTITDGVGSLVGDKLDYFVGMNL